MAKNGEMSPGEAKRVSLSEVQLKLVGESLEVIQDYDQKLRLGCACEGKTCRVSFSKGKPSTALLLVLV